MKFEKVHNKGQARIFRNRYLEILTKTHPVVIMVMYVPLIIISVYYSAIHYEISSLRIFYLFIAGMFSWSLFEYLAHRYVFHFLSESDMGRRLVYVLHGNHHQYPRDKQRLFMPPVPSVLIAGILFSVFKLSMGNNAFVFFRAFCRAISFMPVCIMPFMPGTRLLSG
ncbi:MAG: hypothetical protein ACO3BD_00925 [Chitinophagaceae bacterium]